MKCRFASGLNWLSQMESYNHFTEFQYRDGLVQKKWWKYMIEGTLTVLSDSFGKVEDTKNSCRATKMTKPSGKIYDILLDKPVRGNKLKQVV